MKREYLSPEAEIEKFVLSADSVCTNPVSNPGDGDTGEDVEW